MTLRKIIETALPSRQLAVGRDSLVNATIERIERFREVEPLVEPYRKKTRDVALVADRTQKAIARIHGCLLEMGLEQDIKGAIAERSWLDPRNPRVPIRGASPLIDLHLVLQQTMQSLSQWQRLYRPPKHRPRVLSANLAAHLEELYRKRAGLSKLEFDDFLARLNNSAETSGLPKLTIATVAQRKTRAGRQKRTTK